MEERISVALLDEGVDVGRPVLALGKGDGAFRIVDQPYDRGTERARRRDSDLQIRTFVTAQHPGTRKGRQEAISRARSGAVGDSEGH
jgi:hypothetical protein